MMRAETKSDLRSRNRTATSLEELDVVEIALTSFADDLTPDEPTHGGSSTCAMAASKPQILPHYTRRCDSVRLIALDISL